MDCVTSGVPEIGLVRFGDRREGVRRQKACCLHVFLATSENRPWRVLFIRSRSGFSFPPPDDEHSQSTGRLFDLSPRPRRQGPQANRNSAGERGSTKSHKISSRPLGAPVGPRACRLSKHWPPEVGSGAAGRRNMKSHQDLGRQPKVCFGSARSRTSLEARRAFGGPAQPIK